MFMKVRGQRGHAGAQLDGKSAGVAEVFGVQELQGAFHQAVVVSRDDQPERKTGERVEQTRGFTLLVGQHALEKVDEATRVLKMRVDPKRDARKVLHGKPRQVAVRLKLLV